MADDTGVPRDELEKWMHPKEAFRMASEALGGYPNASSALMGRLAGGGIEAAALSFNTAGGYGQKSNRILRLHWERTRSHITSHSVFWQSSDLIGVDAGSFQRPGQISYFGVRFRPQDVRALIGPSEAAETTVAPGSSASGIPAPVAPKEKYERKGQATDDQLRAWYAAYKVVYGGKPRDTLPFAWDSALGMFPEKEVSRDSVRKIIAAEDGPRDRGPKPKS